MSQPLPPLPLRTAAGSGVVYERLPINCDLAGGSVMEALVILECEPNEAPVLVLSGREFADGYADWHQAVAVALRYGLRVRFDPQMTDADEWYLEWRGRRVGSPGA